MKILKAIMFCVLFFIGIQQGFAAINFTVSPIKYEITINPGVSTSKAATLRNNGDSPVTIYTGKSDFEANGTGGTPSFVRYSELVHPDQQLSSWITIDTPQFVINPGEEKTVNFLIDVPETATPGGHYGAVFFKNPASETSGGDGNIGINVDYGVIILLNVSGEVVTEIEIVDPIISNSGGGTGNNGEGNNSGEGEGSGTNVGFVDDGTDKCVVDFTNSNFDGKCFDSPLTFFDPTDIGNGLAINDFWDDEIDNPTVDNGGETSEDNANLTTNEGINNSNESDDNIDNQEDDFEITFTFPIKNTGNTHVKPTGEIKLIDEDGNQIKGVGKKNKLSEDGAIIGTEVVDYIPINDNGGNVLPDSQRNFDEKWEGFPYQTLDEKGLIIMKDMTPEEYYSKQNLGEDRILMPWERVSYRKNNKNIKALIDLVYTDHNGEEIDFSSAKEFPVSYTEKYIGINPYVVIPFLLFVVILLLLWLIAIGKRRRCVNDDCRKKIKKKMVVCPYCGTKQPNFKESSKKHKKLNKKLSKKKSKKKK